MTKTKGGKGSNARKIRHGLQSNPERWDIDGRTLLAKQLDELRMGLKAMFIGDPDRAAAVLIDRVVYKTLKLAIYEAQDLIGTEALSPSSEVRYMQMANSLRADLIALSTMSRRKPVVGEVDIQTYLASLSEIIEKDGLK
jgi:hypothetical protein